MTANICAEISVSINPHGEGYQVVYGKDRKASALHMAYRLYNPLAALMYLARGALDGADPRAVAVCKHLGIDPERLWKDAQRHA